MKISLIQTNITWADPKENARHIEDLIMNAEESDLYVLPEMWSTGFATEPEGIAEEENGESLRWMQAMANKRHAAIAGSIAVKSSTDGSFRNRFYFVKPHEGDTEKADINNKKPQKGDMQATDNVYYDKRHLFTYGGEHLRYSAGERRVVTEWRGMRFLLLVCYDLRFPVWARNHEDYDCILCIASWPTPRLSAWNTLLLARAIENQCYVAGVNRVGKDLSCNYSGGTQLIDAYGRVTASCQPNTEEVITSEISIDSLNAFRKKFPVLKDRDIF